MADPTGKYIYDIVTAQAAAQAADLAAVAGRAKDLIGIATITTTLTGALANDKLVNISKQSKSDPAVLVLLITGFVLVLGCGYWVLRPRKWSFAPDAELVAEQTLVKHPSWSMDNYYMMIAKGFITPEAGGNTPIQSNAETITFLSRFVTAQIFGLALLAIAGFVLAAEAL